MVDDILAMCIISYVALAVLVVNLMFRERWMRKEFEKFRDATAKKESDLLNRILSQNPQEYVTMSRAVPTTPSAPGVPPQPENDLETMLEAVGIHSGGLSPSGVSVV